MQLSCLPARRSGIEPLLPGVRRPRGRVARADADRRRDRSAAFVGRARRRAVHSRHDAGRPLPHRRPAGPRRHGRSLSSRRPEARTSRRAQVPAEGGHAIAPTGWRASIRKSGWRGRSPIPTCAACTTSAKPAASTSSRWSTSTARISRRLLRRIGRLPSDKALELARQLCAGLAAAHDRRVLHRDLKPANVLIDGRGRAHLADFGLADLTDQRRDAPEIAGTPGYMAPEQLEGREVTTRTDVYALGLVLYEMFTGKRALAVDGARTWRARAARRAAGQPVDARSRSGSRDRTRDHALSRARSGSPPAVGDRRRCGIARRQPARGGDCRRRDAVARHGGGGRRSRARCRPRSAPFVLPACWLGWSSSPRSRATSV